MLFLLCSAPAALPLKEGPEWLETLWSFLLSSFLQIALLRLRTGMGGKVWLFPPCVTSLYDCTSSGIRFFVTFYFYLFVKAGKCLSFVTDLILLFICKIV